MLPNPWLLSQGHSELSTVPVKFHWAVKGRSQRLAASPVPRYRMMKGLKHEWAHTVGTGGGKVQQVPAARGLADVPKEKSDTNRWIIDSGLKTTTGPAGSGWMGVFRVTGEDKPTMRLRRDWKEKALQSPIQFGPLKTARTRATVMEMTAGLWRGCGGWDDTPQGWEQGREVTESRPHCFSCEKTVW